MNILTISCNSNTLVVIFVFVKNFLNLIQISAPILLMISLVYTFIKMAQNPEDKKIVKRIKNACLSTTIIFFIPLFINVTMSLLGYNFEISSCWNNTLNANYNPHYIKDSTEDKINQNIIPNPDDYESGVKKPINNNSSSSSSSSSNDFSTYQDTIVVSGKGNFVKYQLTETQLKQITALALHEQGTAKGAAAEASLMANRFELYGSKYGVGGDGLVNYVATSKWFANAKKNMADFKIVTPEAYNAVKKVLVDGKRTLPKYIDEHDCFSDLTSVKTNGVSIGVSDRSGYKPFNTIIKNRYGATYMFYSFPDKRSDPFGYTSTKKRQQYGDDCYSFEG